MKFAELRAGQVIEAGPDAITEAQIVAFAKDWDPQWFHTDPARADGGPYGGLIASGWQTCCIAMRLAVQTVLAGSETFGSPGMTYLKWRNPVRPGDALTLRATVLDTRRSTSRPTLGILDWRWQLFNQRGEEVLDLQAANLFDLTGA